MQRSKILKIYSFYRELSNTTQLVTVFAQSNPIHYECDDWSGRIMPVGHKNRLMAAFKNTILVTSAMAAICYPHQSSILAASAPWDLINYGN